MIWFFFHESSIRIPQDTHIYILHIMLQVYMNPLFVFFIFVNTEVIFYRFWHTDLHFLAKLYVLDL